MTTEAGAKPKDSPEDTEGKEIKPIDSLGDAIKASIPTYEGHPAMGGETEEEDPDKGETSPDGTEGPEGEEKTPGEAKKPGEKPNEAPPDTPKPKKYKSWEEAEEGAKEHQRFATEKAEEAKRDREAREAAERERDELKQKLAEKEAAPKQEQDKRPRKERIREALQRIDELDRYDENYHDQVAEIYEELGLGAAPDPEQLQALIDKKVEEKLTAKEQSRQQDAKVEDTIKRANELAAKAGLDMRANIGEENGVPVHSPDYTLFWMVSDRAPRDIPLKEQVEWTVREVRRLKGQAVDEYREASDKAKKAQNNNAVLEKGGGAPPPKSSKSEAVLPLKDALSQTRRYV